MGSTVDLTHGKLGLNCEGPYIVIGATSVGVTFEIRMEGAFPIHGM